MDARIAFNLGKEYSGSAGVSGAFILIGIFRWEKSSWWEILLYVAAALIFFKLSLDAERRYHYLLTQPEDP